MQKTSIEKLAAGFDCCWGIAAVQGKSQLHVQDWATMGELPRKEWMESVQLVFDYFCERTPRSFVEARETSVVWNYKYAGQSIIKP